MLSLDRLALGTDALLFAASVASASLLTGLVGWVPARLCRRRDAPVRHAILLTTVGVGVAAPCLLMIGSAIGWDWPAIQIPPAASAGTGIDAAPIACRPTSGSGETIGNQTAAAAATKLGANSPQPSAGGGSAVGWQAPATAVVLLWFVGSFVGAGRAIRGMLVLRRFFATLDAEPRPRLIAAVDAAFRSLGSDRQARVYVTRFAPAPLALGLVRPMIIVPEYLAVDAAGERLRYVLTHEIAHVVRGDPWVAHLQCLAGILYWWNPLLRIVSRQLSQAREEICDDYVLRAGGEARQFAATLLDVAERTALFGLAGGTALLDDDAAALERRIRRLIEPRPTPTIGLGRRALLATTVFGVVLSAIVLGTRVRSAETPQTAEPSPPSSAVSPVEAEANVRARSPTGHSYSGAVVPRREPSPGEKAGPAENTSDLSGDWLLALPAGFEHRVVLTDLGGGRYRLAPRSLNMSGVYERRGRELELVEPTVSRLTEFRWRAEGSDVLRLVAEPPPGKTGARYAGATLRRREGAPDRSGEDPTKRR